MFVARVVRVLVVVVVVLVCLALSSHSSPDENGQDHRTRLPWACCQQHPSAGSIDQGD